MSQVIESSAKQTDQSTDYLSVSEHNAETTVVGALMISPQARNTLRGQLSERLFVHPRHRVVVTALWSAEERIGLSPELGGAANVPTLLAELERLHGQVPPETTQLLWQLSSAAALSPDDLAAAVDLLRDAHARRVLRSTGQRFTQLADRLGRSVSEIRSDVAGALEDLTAATSPTGDHDSAATADWDEFVDTLADEQGPRAHFGLLDLDRALRAEPGQMVAVAARTSIGKTLTGLTLARKAAAHEARTLYLSFEVGRSKIQQRLAAAAGSVDYTNIRDRTLSVEEMDRLRHADIPSTLHVPKAPSRRLPDVISAIHANAATAHANGQVPVTFVDYLQQITPDRNLPNRQEKVGEISGALQEAAQQSESVLVPMIQLSRAAEAREDHRPELTDLRESGSIEQDCDAVVLLHRPDAYDRDHPRMGEMDLILAKNRDGPTATISVAHQLRYQRVVDMARE